MDDRPLATRQVMNGTPLLSLRLSIPSVPATLVTRTELIAALNTGVERPVTLVSAPAGFGKTTTVAAWLAQRSTCHEPTSVAWYTANRSDSDLRLFCAYLLAALRTVHPEAGGYTWQILHSPSVPSPETLADLMVEDLANLKDETILVVDNYHEIRDAEVHTFFGRLLHHLPTNLHLVLLTRNHPPFSLARLRSQHRMTLLNAEQLRFNLAEVKELLALSLEQEVDDDVAAAIYEQVEGWGAALVLFIAAIRDGRTLSIIQQEMMNQGINNFFDYLTTEIVASQTPEIKEFMLHMSILDHFCADLCAAVYPACTPERAHELLLQLERANLLLFTLDKSQVWYHYYSLLRIVLQQRLRQSLSQAEVQACYARAARWFAQTGDTEQAIRFYLNAGAADQAVALLESALPDLQNREQWNVLDRWLHRVPVALLEARPALLLAQAWIAYSRFQYKKMHSLINKATALLADGKGPENLEQESALLGEIESLYASAYIPNRSPQERVTHGQSALELLPAERKFVRGFALQHMADAHRSMGAWQEAVQILQNALYAANSTDQAYTSRLLHGLTLTYGYTGQLQSADRMAQTYHYRAEQAGLPMSKAWAQVLMGTLAYQQNQADVARTHHKQVLEQRHTAHLLALLVSLQDLIWLADTEGEQQWLHTELIRLGKDTLEKGNHEILPSINALEALLWLRQGDLARAWAWAQTATPGERLQGTIPVVETTYIRASLAHGTESALNQAQGMADKLAGICRDYHLLWHLFEVMVLQALLASARGEIEQAFNTLVQVIEQGIPLGFRRVFLQDGPPLQMLLSRFVEAASSPTAPTEWRSAAQLLVQANLAPAAMLPGAGPVPPSYPSVKHSLSDRELEILYLLANKLTNKEIGYNLHISMHTVRNHMVKIFDKLGANSRAEVLVRATEIGLLSRRN